MQEDEAQTPGPGIYQNLVDAGWLTPYPDGYRKLVEMPEVVSRLVRFLSDLERGSATSLGGAVSAMLSALRAARDNPEVNALAIRDTAQRAEDFLWRLRSLVAGLRRLEASILEQRSAGEVLGRFFDRFVSVVISDWHTLKTAQNPYRHRGEIVGTATALLDDETKLHRLAYVYAEQDLAQGVADGVRLVAADLDRIRDALLGLDLLTDRIDDVRRRVERRIAITVSYLELAGGVTTLRLADLLSRLGWDAGPDDRAPFATLASPDGSVGPDMLSGPRRQRERVAAAAPIRHAPDPRLDAFIAARREFQERVRVGNRLLSGFASRQLADGTEVRAADMRVELLEDIVAFCATPVVAGRGRIPRDMTVRLLAGRAIAGGIDGPDYLIRTAKVPEVANDAV